MRPNPRSRRPQPPLPEQKSPDFLATINFQVKEKGRYAQDATRRRLSFAAIYILLVAFFGLSVVAAQESPAVPSTAATSAPGAVPIPRFRAIDADAPSPARLPLPTLRLLAETDFAPWSFTLEDGSLAGISVDLARSACTEAGLTCDIVATPFTSLLPSLLRGEGDGIVSGLRLNSELVAGTAMTRPYFRSMGRFMIRRGTQIDAADPRALAGRRIGVVAGTAHEVFLKKHYDKAQLVPLQSETRMYEDLRTGALDAAFGDSLRMSFWMNSDGARKCCTGLGGAVLDPETFSRPLVYIFRKDKAAVRDRLDEALDQLEEKGATAEIFGRYLPAPIW
jgi:polar amino acid transport system substrate-binding protein